MFEGVSKVFQGCFKEVLEKFQETFKGLRCFKEVTRVLKESVKCV